MPLTKDDIQKVKERVKQIEIQNAIKQNELNFKMVNEFIVTELKYLENFCNEKQSEIDKLKAENEQLKSKLKEMETVNKIYLLLP